MVNWVGKHVVQGISTQQERETMAKCTADLKLLALGPSTASYVSKLT